MISPGSDRHRLGDSPERIAISTPSSPTTQYYEASQNLDSRQPSRSPPPSLLERRTVSRPSDDSYTLSSHSNHRRSFDLDRHNLRWGRPLGGGRATIRTHTCQCGTYVKTWSPLACARLAETTDPVDPPTRLSDPSVYGSNDLERQSTTTPQVDNAGEEIAIPLKRLLSIARWRPVECMPDATSGYVVVGIFNGMNNVPKESLVYFKSTWRHDLRKSLRSAIHDIRGWRRILSLKRVTDFGVYKCDPSLSSHERISIDEQTQATLSQFFLDYNSKDLSLTEWYLWISKNMNQGRKPYDGHYSLELKLGWSVTMIGTLTATPVILSLAIGTWYMQKTGDVQTAWTIASYIVTTAGILIALLAAITQIGGI